MLMKADCEGVAGFFEDLPVLMFVLAGVLVIVATSVWTSNMLDEGRTQDRLDALADQVMNELVLRIEQERGGVPYPTLSGLTSLNMSHVARCITSVHSCSVAIVERHPDARWLVQWSGGDSGLPTHVAGASKLLNALDERLMVVVVEVRVVVW